MSLLDQISTIPGIVLYRECDLTKYTTMRLSSTGDLAEVHSVEALQKLLPLLSREKKEWLVVGWGANQILPAQVHDLVIYLDFPFDPASLDSVKSSYDLPASAGLNHLTAHAVKFGLKGWEVFTGIPASLGGAIYMNAGTNLGEVGSLVKRVRIVCPDGSMREEKIGPESFSYRKNHFLKKGEIIVSAVLTHFGQEPLISEKIKEYLEYRKKTQPLATKNCGCVFKNPTKSLQAGRLIDLAGLKGLTVGGLRVSPKHANFIENTGASDWDQFQSLVKVITSTMDQFYGLEFELEVKIPYH